MIGGEFTGREVSETKTQTVENFRNIKPEREMSFQELKNAIKDELNKVANEYKSGENAVSEKNLDPIHKDCLTTSEERKEFAANSKGEWEGEPGNSRFYPDKKEAREALEKYHESGIDYRDGEPDFSRTSEITVKIDDMTSNRDYNFRQADKLCAEQWNKEARDGKTDWKRSDVEAWKRNNGYSWHERLDRTTMDLVQRDIHEECKHYGGVAECKRKEMDKKRSENM